MSTNPPLVEDHRVADLALHGFGRNEIRLAEHEMPGLMALRAEFADQQPLAGARIAGSLAGAAIAATAWRSPLIQ